LSSGDVPAPSGRRADEQASADPLILVATLFDDERLDAVLAKVDFLGAGGIRRASVLAAFSTSASMLIATRPREVLPRMDELPRGFDRMPLEIFSPARRFRPLPVDD